MNSRAHLVLGALGLSLMVELSALAPVRAQGTQPKTPALAVPAAAPVLKAETLTKGQFKGLPDSAVIELKGQRTTAGAIRAERQQRDKQVVAQFRAGTRQASAKIEAARAQFLKKQKAELAAKNATVGIEFGRVSQRLEVVRREANDLHARLQTASPVEKVQIQQRARELQQQLRRVTPIAK